MPIRFVCPQCGQAGRLPESFQGDRIKCPACKIISPVGSGPPPASAVSPAEERGPPRTTPGAGPRHVGSGRGRIQGGDRAGRRTTSVTGDREAPTEDRGRHPGRRGRGGTRAPAGCVDRRFGRRRGRDPRRHHHIPADAPWRRAAPGPTPIQGGVAGITAEATDNAPRPTSPSALAPGPGTAVADLFGNPGNRPQGTIGPTPLGASPSDGAALQSLDRSSAPAIGQAPGAITPKPVGQGPTLSADAVKRIQDATVYLKVQAGRVRGTGSGFVIQSNGGTVLIATNNHVANPHLEGAPQQDVASRNPDPADGDRRVPERGRPGSRTDPQRPDPRGRRRGESRPGRSRGTRVEGPPEPIALSEPAEPTLLMPVLIYGFPFGNIDDNLDRSVQRNPTMTVNRGSVSSMLKDRFNRLSHIQIDGSINPGNSGGPVVDEAGRLVGVTVSGTATPTSGSRSRP